jgi:hypothetical protein
LQGEIRAICCPTSLAFAKLAEIAKTARNPRRLPKHARKQTLAQRFPEEPDKSFLFFFEPAPKPAA